MEQWRDIEGYEGLYQVSDWGRVKSLNYLHTGVERLLVGIKNKDGYLRVCLWKDGKRKWCKVHRLVTQAFIPNPYGLPQVNHKDENPANNVVSNLEWCDCKYNINYGTHNERIAKALSKPVYQYTKDGSLVRSYPSVREAERRTGYRNSTISECCNGKQKSAYGYLWSYNLFAPRGRLF